MGLIDCLLVFLIACLALKSSFVLGSDPSPLQDFCVAIDESNLLVNGKLCKDPSLVTTNDFFLPGFDKPGNTSNAFGSGMTPATIDQIPGLNGQGISLVRIDFAPKGVLPMSYRGEGSQILLVMEGTLYVGFVTSDPANRLISKVLHKGDVYALPQGFPNVIYNVDHTCNAVAIIAINNQSPYFMSTKAIFGSEPTIQVEFLAKSCKIDEIYVNGKFCKNPKLVTPNDFYLSGFDKPGNRSSSFGYNATRGTVDELPGLNTLGIAMHRVDYAPQGLAPLHSHPRGSSVIIVIQGCVYVGFVTSDPENRLIAKELKTGDVFAIPAGLIHFTYNVGDTNAVTLVASNSQKPGFLSTRGGIFGSNPTIPVEFLAKSFKVDEIK
ncbi:hypothetical protein Syun_026560 [Stephania yunnanensis]|uniref:Cupin type-1 domain-containing protein n=1 Tax=Stephania yunnanensis TaxID=152371 RepID=A0AAP0EWG5_9MAGN